VHVKISPTLWRENIQPVPDRGLLSEALTWCIYLLSSDPLIWSSPQQMETSKCSTRVPVGPRSLSLSHDIQSDGDWNVGSVRQLIEIIPFITALFTTLLSKGSYVWFRYRSLKPQASGEEMEGRVPVDFGRWDGTHYHHPLLFPPLIFVL
jgi:hypothetical protein